MGAKAPICTRIPEFPNSRTPLPVPEFPNSCRIPALWVPNWAQLTANLQRTCKISRPTRSLDIY